MKNMLKQEKGVSLISLAATIIVIGIITTMLLYSITDSNHVQTLTNLYSDIDNLTGKVATYYSNYGKIPALKFDVSGINTIMDDLKDNPKGENDTGDYLVVDLSAIENLTLNYGRDYQKIKNNEISQIENNTDLYVINENSHNIFYLKGIKVENHYYYTNQDIDKEKVDLRYVDGIKIYDGYTYVSGNKKTGITIKKDGEQLEWQNVADNIATVTEDGDSIVTVNNGNSITIELGENQNKTDFLDSVKNFGGFYLDKISKKVLYFSSGEDVESNWTLKYDKDSIYKDENGDTAYIPEGFQVSKLSSMNKIENGLVIRNATTKDEYVWIDVPYNILKDANTLEEIENALKEYTKDYRKDGYEDSWYEGCGFLNESEYNELKNKMYLSIKQNGGFYIGRYEAGTNTARTSGNSGTDVDSIRTANGTPLSQKGKYPYNFVTIGQAQKLSYSENDGKYTTSLMFGIQWDLVCKFIEDTGAKTKAEIMLDSSTWGNYGDQIFYIDDCKYYTPEELWKDANGINKPNISLLTTGNSKRNCTLNIFDLAGNVMELTLEKKSVVLRGGHFEIGGNYRPFSDRGDWRITDLSAIGGFRVTIFK